MQPTKHINLFKFTFTAFLICAVLTAAYSSVNNSGKTKKRAGVRSGLSLNMHSKSLHFSTNSGYYFKGGISNQKNSKSGMTMHIHSIHFQKGNSLYVLPFNQKVTILSKFKAPQKSY